MITAYIDEPYVIQEGQCYAGNVVPGGPLGYAFANDWLRSLDPIVLGPKGQLVLSSRSTLKNCVIVREGLDLPVKDLNDWVGTAISIPEGESKWDITIENVLVLGFAQALDAHNCPRLTLRNFHFDCLNGVNIVYAEDCIHLDTVEGWPYCGIDPKLYRQRGFYFGKMADAAKIRHCFCYGYKVGYEVEDASDLSFLQSGADGWNPADWAKDSCSMYIHGNCRHIKLVDFHAYSHEYGLVVTTNSKDHKVFVNGGTIGYNKYGNVVCNSGTVECYAVEFTDTETCCIDHATINTHACSFYGIKKLFLGKIKNIFQKLLTKL